MDREGEILAAVSALHERMEALEKQMESIDRKADGIAKIDRKVNAMARRLLSPVELVSLGIPDARPQSGSAGNYEPPNRMAAAGTE